MANITLEEQETTINFSRTQSAGRYRCDRIKRIPNQRQEDVIIQVDEKNL